MDIDIKPIEKRSTGYRGVDRLLNPHHFKYKNKKMFDKLIEMYFDYISYTFLSEEIDTLEMFNRILPFYSLLAENGVSCEIIICNEEPVTNFYNEKIEFLGIDIVNQHYESLLTDPSIGLPINILNKNLLCNGIDDCTKIINLLEGHILTEYGHEMKPVYVYVVLC